MVLLQTPTPNLLNSLNFYKKAGFQVLSESDPTVVSDGAAVIEINPDRYARAGLKMYASSWEEVANKMEEKYAFCKIDNGYLLSDPSGIWIYLIETDSPPSYSPDENAKSLFGNSMGLSIECVSMSLSCKFYEGLGFKIAQGTVDSGWMVLTHESGFGISLMKPNSCPHLFFNPSLTYFNGGTNDVVIPKIREAGIPITEEITHFNPNGEVDNIIIRDPAGFGFFIFND